MALRQAIDVVALRSNAKRLENDGVEFNPKKNRVLPEPPGKKPSSRRITFSKPAEEIRLVAKALLDDENTRPGIVGEKCFDLALAKAKKKGS